MERKPLSTTGNIVGVVLLLVVVPLGLYVGGYFVLSRHYGPCFREYRYDWLAYGYLPMARVEAAWIIRVVELIGPTETYYSNGEVFLTHDT